MCFCCCCTLHFFKTDTQTKKKQGIEIHKRLFVNIIQWLTFLLTLFAGVCGLTKGAHYERKLSVTKIKANRALAAFFSFLFAFFLLLLLLWTKVHVKQTSNSNVLFFMKKKKKGSQKTLHFLKYGCPLMTPPFRNFRRFCENKQHFRLLNLVIDSKHHDGRYCYARIFYVISHNLTQWLAA